MLNNSCDLMAVVEYKCQVSAALAYSSGYKKPCFYACTVAVAEALREAGATVYVSTDFTDDAALQRYGETSYQLVEQLCANLDDLLAKQNDEIMEKDIRPFSMEHYRMKNVCDGAVVRLAELLDALQSLKPQSVLAFVDEKTEPLGLDVGEDFTFLYGNDIARICEQLEIASILVHGSRPRQHAYPKPLNGLQRLFRFIKHHGVRKTSARIFGLLKAKVAGKKQGKGILVLQPIVLDEALVPYVPIWRWRGAGQPIVGASGLGVPVGEDMSMSIARPAFGEDRQIREFFSFRGIDWFDYAETHLDAFLDHELPECLANCRAADEAFRTLSVGAVTATNLGADSFLRHVAARARKASVPVVVLQHGAIGFQREFSYHYQEFRYCSHYLIYAPGCSTHFTNPLPVELEHKTVGSPSLDFASRPAMSKADVCRRYGLDTKKPLVIFPSVVHAWRNRQLVMATENEFRHTEIQSAIMKALLVDPNVQIIVKGNMGDTADDMPVVYKFRSQYSERVRCVTDLPFVAFLDAADCFVMDMPSTMLLEAMTRDRRVYAFNQCYTWEEEGLALLDDGITLERESLPRFCATLKRDITSGAAFAPRERGGAFFRHYGDPFDDGKSYERVVEALVALTHEGCWAA